MSYADRVRIDEIGSQGSKEVKEVENKLKEKY